MSINHVVSIISFITLVSMFYHVEVLPFSAKKEKIISVLAVLFMAVVSAALFAGTDMPDGQVTLFVQTIPSLVLCWMMAQHKDLRFWFVFCLIDVVGFMTILFCNGTAVMFHLNDGVRAGLNILVLILIVLIIRKYGKEWKKSMEKVEKNWGMPALFVLLIYAFSYFLTLYPVPWMERPEYAPVVIGYSLLMLLCCAILIKMLVGMNRISHMEQERLRMKLELEETKSRIMLDQIHPHFIYNTLASIRYFVKKEPQTAYDMLYDFSRYLRSNIDSLTGNEYISWEEELEHINAYVSIEKMRFKERLNVIYELEDADFLLPPLTVELLVENAIKHGVSVKTDGGTVWIRGKKRPGGYLVIVEDDGAGFEVEKLEREKTVGLNYIRAQLKKMPGSGMKIESSPGSGTTVSVFFTGNAGERMNEDNVG
ncbi:MAG: histidine kinase [Eubacteriales bacterium]|nr:histidine kinase [Eubacteriales bacterium]